jgi:isopentenyl diphosphate isomerase/L-lactate dehydrogenase-like FMN-dependent dehydrogenase
MPFAPRKGLNRHINGDQATGTNLTFGEHASQGGVCSICTKCGACEIGKRAETGTTMFPEPFGSCQFGAEKAMPGIHDLQIMPELYGPNIVFKKVRTETTLGGFKVRAPIAVAAMGSTMVAHVHGAVLAEGAAKAGIPMTIGENVVASYGEQGLVARIQPFLKSYDGKGAIIVQCQDHDEAAGAGKIAKKAGAHGIEVKLGQGAKQGLGGEIKFEGKENADKFRKMGYIIIENPDGSFQRHANAGSISDDELRKKLEHFASYGLPLWVKTGVGRGLVRLVKAIDESNKELGGVVKNLTIDGFGGGTGMSPWLVMNECSIPSILALQAIDFKPSFDITVAGGFTNGIDGGKALMMGANGFAMGRPFLIAANKTSKSRKLGAQGVVNFVDSLVDDLQMACAIQKQENIKGLRNRRANLFAMSREAGELFGVPFEAKKAL